MKKILLLLTFAIIANFTNAQTYQLEYTSVCAISDDGERTPKRYTKTIAIFNLTDEEIEMYFNGTKLIFTIFNIVDYDKYMRFDLHGKYTGIPAIIVLNSKDNSLLILMPKTNEALLFERL